MQNSMKAGPGTTSPQVAALLQGHKSNPLAIAALAAVLVFSLVGVAAITGLLPTANSQKAVEVAQKSADVTAASRTQNTRPPARVAKADACAVCGTVDSVHAVEVKGSGTGLGAVAGGVAGAVVGNQIGSGNGNTAMTILGAAGGALAGNEIEKNVKKQMTYRVTVRMDDGSFRTVSQSTPAAIGEKVRVVDGSIAPRS